MSEIDIEKFSKEVFQEFEIIKATKVKFPADKTENESPRNLSGCLSLPIAKIGDAFVKRIIERERKNRKYPENERYAESLLSRNDVRAVVCRALKNFSKKDILTEEKFVRTVTAALADAVSRRKFTMPLEPVLFAAAAYHIFAQGIEKFCENVSDE